MEIKDPIDAPVMPTLENKWQGWPLDTALKVAEVLAAEEIQPGSDEIGKSLPFYCGTSQWKPEIVRARIDQGRPTMTINMLPQIVARILGNSSDITTTFDERYRLIAIVVRHNRDAQAIYNYVASCNAEFASQRPTKIGAAE